jgi:hypothetical protein
MPGNVVELDDGTPVEVKLSADSKGMVSLGIRINGGNWNVLCQSLITPRPGSSQSWSAIIKDLM